MVVARRPPKRIALIGTPAGSSHAESIDGHWLAGAVKQPFGSIGGHRPVKLLEDANAPGSADRDAVHIALNAPRPAPHSKS